MTVGVAVDTSFVIDLLQGHDKALAKARELEGEDEPRFLPAPVLYEVEAGLRFTRSRLEAARFREIAGGFPLLPLDEAAALAAAKLRAELLRLGRPKSHSDVMIAGTAMAGNHRLVTRDADIREVGEEVGLLVEGY